MRILAVTAIGVILVSSTAVVAAHWPFTRAAAAKSLGEAFASKVEFKTFQQRWFPRPGFEASGVTLTPAQGRAAGYASVSKLEIKSSWAGLLRHRVQRLIADDAAIEIRALGEGTFAGHAGSTIIEQGEMRRAVLQVGSENDRQRFDFHDVQLQNVGHSLEVGYRILAGIPRPRGELELAGKLGPLFYGEISTTPLKGSYELTRADLGVFQGIAGILASKGTYDGVLERLNVAGETQVPDFSVVESGHAHHLAVKFQAVVNGANGDTVLPRMDATLDRTSLVKAQARIEGVREKSISLEIPEAHGHIEDLMLLFIKARESPMMGAVGFRSHIVVPPGQRPFKQRVILDGDFGISAADFTTSSTQTSVDELSERAEGRPHDAPERVVSDLAGHVALRNGIASFSNISFRVPNATANLSGTFSIVSEKIDLHGHLATRAKLSKTSTGIKSVFLKLLDPVFKRKNAGAVIPVSITGTYDQPAFHELVTK